MTEESGFFNDTAVGIGSTDAGSYHDFREIYASRTGFSRVLTVKRQGRIFVLKCLRDQFRNDIVALAALRKEYDCGYAVDSPYVVHTLDYLDLPETGPAIRLEFCPGRTLADLIEEGMELAADDVDSIVAGISGGLADLHSLGIVHRDIKPSNIIYSGSTRRVCIIDLGCADADDFTFLHNPAGTKGYTPEDVAADRCRADRKSDFYAAGVTLSRLSLIAPPSRHKALLALASEMTSGNISDRDSALKFYKSATSEKRFRKRAGISAAVVVVLVAVVMIFGSDRFGVSHSENVSEVGESGLLDPEESDDAGIEASQNIGKRDPDVEISAPIVNHSPAEVATGSAVNHLPDEVAAGSAVNHSPAEVAAGSGGASTANAEVSTPAENQTPGDLQWPDYVLPEERVKNSYGVALAEAKYTAIFKRNKIDALIVQRVDNAMQMCLLTYSRSDASDAEKLAAKKRYRNFGEISDIVGREVKRKYPEADSRRILGMVQQRMKVWHSGYSSFPYEVVPPI